MDTYKDYLLILSLPDKINQQVKKYRQSTARLIGDFEGMHGKAHITLKRLRRQRDEYTDQLFTQIAKELSLLEPITLQINGFATFLPTDYTTIYAAIKSTPAMEDWFKRLRRSLEEKKAVPHITIARQVPNELAKKVWPKFKDRPWDDKFELKRLTILYRETYSNDKKWEHYKDITFRGDPEWNRLVDKEKEKLNIKGDVNQISLF